MRGESLKCDRLPIVIRLLLIGRSSFDLFFFKKALYGLKQSPRVWFRRFTQTMKIPRYRHCNGDQTLFFQHFPSGGVIILVVYLDDNIITRNDDKEEK